MIFWKRTAVLLTALLMLMCTGCSLFEKKGDLNEQITEASSDIDNDRYISTTQTARLTLDADANDEDLQGYSTTTQDTETGTLENPPSDEPDPDILATTSATKRTTTTTKKKATSTKKTSATAETTLVKNKLHSPLESEKHSTKKKYKVVSDTTYLNLRYGPSKEYDVQLKIPDGETIYGTAKTRDNKGNNWIYVSYKNTYGWVMEELLSPL